MAKAPDQVLRQEILALTAYHVGDAAGMVKLDAMENPYELPEALRQGIVQRVAGAALNRYPDANARSLKARLRNVMQIPEGMEIVLGNGSDELIQMLALAVARPGAAILGVEPSFVMFRMMAAFAGLHYVGVPLNADFSLDVEQVLAAIAEHKPALIFIAYPNNPSGNLFDERGIVAIIEAAPGIVVVDEAYHVFAGRSFVPRLPDFSNLLIMRTLSKLGLAGLRLGLLAGGGSWLSHIDKLRLPYNINVLTQLVADEVLRHSEVLEQQAAAIRDQRRRMHTELSRIRGVQAYSSDANFILFRVATADIVFNRLKQRGVLIKNLSGSHPLLADCLRVTVGTPAENAQFIAALAASITH